MALNWSQLAPHRPLAPGDPLHVQRPQGSGDELAARILTGGIDVVAIVGPVGSGKSTELAQATSLLAPHYVTALTQLDRVANMRTLTEDGVFTMVAQSVEHVARAAYSVGLSAGLKNQLHPSADSIGGAQPRLSSRDLLLSVMREVKRGSAHGNLALLVDGLEKCDADVASRVVRALLDVREEARLVFVAPYSVVVGSGGHDLQASGAHYHFVRAVPVRDDQLPEAVAGRQFLCDVANFRLGIDSMFVNDAVMQWAAVWSGGLPRSFLQLVQAAGSYAALDGRHLLSGVDLNSAVIDQRESLARLLEKGDVDRLREADGKSEHEIPSADRVRLLMQGLLLEYKTARQGTIVHPARLLQDLLARPAT